MTMKGLRHLAVALLLCLSALPCQAQTQPGQSPLSVAKGGSGHTTFTTNCIPFGAGVSPLGCANPTNNGVLVYGAGGIPASSTTLPNGLAFGTPASGTLTNLTGLPIASGVSGLGTGVATFLATPSSANLRAALTDEVGTGAAYFVGGALGTPSSGTATNLTGLPIASGVSGLGTGVATFLATPSSANMAAAVTDETGTGALVFANSPALTGTPTAPTPAPSDNSTKLATTAYVDNQVVAGTAGVTSIDTATGAITISNGLARTGNDLRVSLTKLTNSLGSDVAISNSSYTDGPSIAQGTSGTWWVAGTVTFLDTAAATQFKCKLWDGTTVIASANSTSAGANFMQTCSLSGYITSPAANLRISVTSNAAGATSTFKFNSSGNSKDSTISAIRIG